MKFGFAAAMVLSVLVVAGLVFMLDSDGNPLLDGKSGSGKPLVFYCAAGIRKPVEDVMQQYKQEYGIEFQTKYAGSGALLSDMRVGEGDLYLAADVTYFHEARKMNLVREIVPIANQSPVLAVRRGNPKNIRGLEDVTGEGIDLSLADPKVAAVSRVAKRLLKDERRWNALWENTTVHRSTVNEVANDVKMGNADAGIVWDATAGQYDELEMVEIPEYRDAPNQISIGVLEKSSRPARALHFIRYLTAPEKGGKAFQKHGYRVIRGDKWAEKPEIHVFAGGLNRLAIEETIDRFKKREGVEIISTYNGCGILVGQMKIGEHPDMYFACDVSFMDQVQDLFVNPTNVSKTDMVIITEKGNPHKIAAIEDMGKPGLKVALCDPQKSALGKLTDDLLRKLGLREKVLANLQATSATADNLVQYVVVGKMDAAIVYRANTVPEFEKLTVLPIDDPTANAVQPIAVGKETIYPHLTGRLMEAVMSAESKKTFDRFGFEWLLETKP